MEFQVSARKGPWVNETFFFFLFSFVISEPRRGVTNPKYDVIEKEGEQGVGWSGRIEKEIEK